MNSIKFRNFKKEDTRKVLKIYNYHIKNGLNNFEEKIFTFDKFLNFSKEILKSKLPFIICERNKEIIGFAYLNQFRNKSGYKYSFENTIYIDIKFVGMGYGNELLKRLVDFAKTNIKIKTIIAVIGSINSKPSIAIHTKNGFKTIGKLKKIGFKKNKWIDAIYMQKVFK